MITSTVNNNNDNEKNYGVPLKNLAVGLQNFCMNVAPIVMDANQELVRSIPKYGALYDVQSNLFNMQLQLTQNESVWDNLQRLGTTNFTIVMLAISQMGTTEGVVQMRSNTVSLDKARSKLKKLFNVIMVSVNYINSSFVSVFLGICCSFNSFVRCSISPYCEQQ